MTGRTCRSGSIFFNPSACAESGMVYTLRPVPPTSADCLERETGTTDSNPVSAAHIRVPRRQFGPVHCSCFLSRWESKSVPRGCQNKNGVRLFPSGQIVEIRSSGKIRFRSSPLSFSVSPKITMSESGSAFRNFCSPLVVFLVARSPGTRQTARARRATQWAKTRMIAVYRFGASGYSATLLFPARPPAARHWQRNASDTRTDAPALKPA